MLEVSLPHIIHYLRFPLQHIHSTGRCAQLASSASPGLPGAPLFSHWSGQSLQQTFSPETEKRTTWQSTINRAVLVKHVSWQTFCLAIKTNPILLLLSNHFRKVHQSHLENIFTFLSLLVNSSKTSCIWPPAKSRSICNLRRKSLLMWSPNGLHRLWYMFSK